jgi:hypothetical protein
MFSFAKLLKIRQGIGEKYKNIGLKKFQSLILKNCCKNDFIKPFTAFFRISNHCEAFLPYLVPEMRQYLRSGLTDFGPVLETSLNFTMSFKRRE